MRSRYYFNPATGSFTASYEDEVASEIVRSQLRNNLPRFRQRE